MNEIANLEKWIINFRKSMTQLWDTISESDAIIFLHSFFLFHKVH